MFNRLDRYISAQLIWASIFILMLISCLQALLSFLHELAQTDENYLISEAVLFTALMIPSRMLDIFPMSVLIGSLSALGNMAGNSELTVMRAAGMTTWRIAGAAIKGSIILMILVVLVSEWLAPVATKAAHQLKAAELSEGQVNLSKSGMWAKKGEQIIHIKNVVDEDNLTGITIYQFDQNKRLSSIIKASAAKQTNDFWLLHQVNESVFMQDTILQKEESERMWENPIEKAQLDTLTLSPEMLNFAGLIGYLSYLSENKLETSGFELALWRKITQPLAIAIMIFIATSFVFGPMRNVSVGARVLTGVALGFAFHLANQSFGPISLVYQIPPILGAIIPLLIFAFIGYRLMLRSA